MTSGLTILPRQLSALELPFDQRTYSGRAIEPEPTVLGPGIPGEDGQPEREVVADAEPLDESEQWENAEGDTVTQRTNWTLSYAGNTDVGEAVVTAVGQGNYAGTVRSTFSVMPYSLDPDSGNEVTFEINPAYYAGVALTPKPTVSVLLDPADEEERILELGTEYTIAYSLASGEPTSSITSAGNYAVLVTGRGNFTGTYTGNVTVGKASSGGGGNGGRTRVPMYRLYNPNSGEHFYTAGEVERNTLMSLGWSYEGIGWYAPSSSKTPVYRLYNPNSGDHHYTTSAGERNALRQAGWSFEGIGWYSDDAMGVPLYRQYNPNATTGSHNYTTSKAENDALVAAGWVAEGIGWYGLK
jgi:hypothetical protein